MEQHRRETDQLWYKINRVAATIGAIAAICGAVMVVGSKWFVTVDAAECERREATIRIERVEVKQIESDKTLVDINATLKAMNERIGEIRQDVRDIKRR